MKFLNNILKRLNNYSHENCHGLNCSKITVITTFLTSKYTEYAFEMLLTTRKNWPEEVRIKAYYEGDVPEPLVSGVEYIDLLNSSPKLVRFKDRFKDDERANGMKKTSETKPYNFRFDAIRFSHKCYALFHAFKSLNSGFLIWLDADTKTFRKIDKQTLLEKFLPRDGEIVSYLGRDMMYSECGFVGYNINHKLISDFFGLWEMLYNKGKVLKLKETHDSYVFDYVRNHFESKLMVKSRDISGSLARSTKHPFVNSELGNFMDHLKGERKAVGKSLKEDFLVKKEQAYWQELSD